MKIFLIQKNNREKNIEKDTWKKVIAHTSAYLLNFL